MTICNFYLLATWVIGAAAAYMDIDRFYRKRRVSILTVLRHIPTDIFIIANGLLGVMLIAWALRTGNESPINRILPDLELAKVLTVGVSVPVLIRSKFFSFGENRKPFGVEFFYEWIRNKTLYSLNHFLLNIKDVESSRFARLFQGDNDVSDDLWERVRETAQQFPDEFDVADLQKEYKNYERQFVDEVGSEKHLKKTIRWAMDTIGVEPTKEMLEKRRSSDQS